MEFITNLFGGTKKCPNKCSEGYSREYKCVSGDVKKAQIYKSLPIGDKPYGPLDGPTFHSNHVRSLIENARSTLVGLGVKKVAIKPTTTLNELKARIATKKSQNKKNADKQRKAEMKAKKSAKKAARDAARKEKKSQPKAPKAPKASADDLQSESDRLRNILKQARGKQSGGYYF